MAKKKEKEQDAKHPPVQFLIDAGVVTLKWRGSEYRAYLDKRHGAGAEEMKLGANSAEALKKYIVEERSNG